jgi:hypothetical protein
MMRRLTVLTAVLALAGLTGCQTWGPTWSEISGTRYTVTELNRFPTLINAVDAQNPGPRIGARNYSYYKVEPGHHTVELQAINRNPNWVSGINLRNAELDIQPCKRYYVNAEFDNPLLTDWKPVVDYVEAIPGCGTGGGSASGYK